MRDSEGHMVGLVGLCRVMGEWSVRQWIVGVINFPKMYGLYGLKVEMLPIRTDKQTYNEEN